MQMQLMNGKSIIYLYIFQFYIGKFHMKKTQKTIRLFRLLSQKFHMKTLYNLPKKVRTRIAHQLRDQKLLADNEMLI